MPASTNALIGYTGFVGSNILKQYTFEHLYDSKNIEEVQGKNFDLIVCAAAPGTKWLANKEPGDDLATIERLMTNLKTVTAKKFVLISSIDVYSPVDAVNEDTAIIKDTLQPYGKHRRMLEEFIARNFDSLIVRLPALFGRGLKKNSLYDLVHHSSLSIPFNSKLQFYNLDYLWADINKSLGSNLEIINFATEPIAIGEIANKIFNLDLADKNAGPAQNYNMNTKYGYLWGNTKPYIYLKDEIITDIKLFVNREKYEEQLLSGAK